MRAARVWALVAGAILFPAPAALAAQAAIVGTVRDAETAAPLAGAIVALTELDRATATNASGHYALDDVPAGSQQLTIRFVGYAPRSLQALVPDGGRLQINVSLRPEPVRIPTLEVRAPVVVRGAGADDTTAYADRGLSIAAVRNHPLLAEPDVFQALGGGEVALRPESPSGLHVRGGSTDQTAYMLDGVPIFTPYHAAGVWSAWSPDAISHLRLSSEMPPLATAHALCGVVEGHTRAPGASHRAQAGLSTAQSRITLDGPLGRGRAGYLASYRAGLPDLLVPTNEGSYLGGETGDWLAKIEAPLLGGAARLLAYDNHNEIDGASATDAEVSAGAVPSRNVFEWYGQSLGAEWRRASPSGAVRFIGWRARASARSDWTLADGRVVMTAARRDEGASASVERIGTRATTALELRIETGKTSYRTEPDSAGGPAWRIGARTSVVSALAQHTRAIGAGVQATAGVSAATGAGGPRAGPRAQLRWDVAPHLRLSGTYARTHQFAQSLRNTESVVASVFPADLFVGADAPGVPVARGDQGVVAADFRPRPGARLGVQAYARRSRDLVLVAPRDGEPFATTGFAVGSATSRGIAADGAVSTTRYGLVASYGLQRVRFEHAGSSYIPEHGATHLLEGGVIVFPAAGSSIRLGATAAFGRTATIVPGPFEWEACNLLDQGCEFIGSPHYGSEPLGGARLPAYFRVDVGVRQSWVVDVGGRTASVALFGTVTNILGRTNVLTYSRDLSTGGLAEIEMRPTSPLVVGLEGRF
jgi:hypothetical protein